MTETEAEKAVRGNYCKMSCPALRDWGAKFIVMDELGKIVVWSGRKGEFSMPLEASKKLFPEIWEAAKVQDWTTAF